MDAHEHEQTIEKSNQKPFLTWNARDRLEEQHPPQPPRLRVRAVRVVESGRVEGAADELDARVRELLAEGLGLEVGGADRLLRVCWGERSRGEKERRKAVSVRKRKEKKRGREREVATSLARAVASGS